MAAAGPRSNWPSAILHEIDRQEGSRIAGAAAGQHDDLGVDHEAVHEAQENGDGQHMLELRQLDVAEHRPGPRAVDLGGLVVGIGNGNEAGVAQEHDQRGPVPDVHEHGGEPGAQRLAGVIVGDAQRVDELAEKADVGQREDVPHGADDVPRDEQRQRHEHETDRNPWALARHGEGDGEAQRNLDQQRQGGEHDLAQQGGMETLRVQHLLEPGVRPTRKTHCCRRFPARKN